MGEQKDGTSQSLYNSYYILMKWVNGKTEVSPCITVTISWWNGWMERHYSTILSQQLITPSEMGNRKTVHHSPGTAVTDSWDGWTERQYITVLVQQSLTHEMGEQKDSPSQSWYSSHWLMRWVNKKTTSQSLYSSHWLMRWVNRKTVHRSPGTAVTDSWDGWTERQSITVLVQQSDSWDGWTERQYIAVLVQQSLTHEMGEQKDSTSQSLYSSHWLMRWVNRKTVHRSPCTSVTDSLWDGWTERQYMAVLVQHSLTPNEMGNRKTVHHSPCTAVTDSWDGWTKRQYIAVLVQQSLTPYEMGEWKDRRLQTGYSRLNRFVVNFLWRYNV